MEDVGEIPGVIGNYRVLGLIGAGGMGAVLRAEHTLLGRGAAVKILRPQYSQNHEIVTRFFNEAKAATAIKHPSIIEVYDFGYLPNGAAYLVMELLDGQSLRARLEARGRLTESESLAIVRGIAAGLAAAHAKGIIHRDIKPDNIFLVPDPEQPSRERVKLLDFGIAKLSADGAADRSRTRSGAVLGTPTHMAPEQCKGAGRVDHRADLYSVGCVLMQLLSGAPPFLEEGAGELIGAHLFVEPPTLRSRVPDCSERANWLVARLLAKNPDERIQSALELVELCADVPSAAGPVVSGSMWVPPVSRSLAGTGETTLGGAAHGSVQYEGQPRRRWPFVVAGIGVVAAAGVVIALAAGGGGANTTTPNTTTPATPAATTPTTAMPNTTTPAATPTTTTTTPTAATPTATTPPTTPPPIAPSTPSSQAVDAGVLDGPPPAVDAGTASKPPRTARPRTKKPEDLLKGL